MATSSTTTSSSEVRTVIANSGVTTVLHTDKFLLGTEVSDLLTGDDNHGIITFGPGGEEIKNSQEQQILFTTRRVNEKANLQTLNNRFAMYTRKVRALEDQNAALLLELAKFENRTETDWDEIYAPKIAGARQSLSTEQKVKSTVFSERDHFQSQIALWKAKYEQQIARYQELLAIKSSITTTTSTDSMSTEISANEAAIVTETAAFKTEIASLREQCKNAGEIHVIQCCDDTDIQVELDRMRDYYEGLNAKMLVELVEKKKKVVKEEKKTEIVDNSAEISATEIEVSKLRISVNSLQMELEQLQFAKSSMIKKMEAKQLEYKAEYVQIEATVVSAETDYKNLKLAMAAQLKKYAELMNTKIGLDMEIATYRKLVDSETNKLDKYDDAISFESLHKFYAYSSEKEGHKKVINLSKAQWNKIENDASAIKFKENVRPIDISKTKLGTNPYFSGKMSFPDLEINSATYEKSLEKTIKKDW